MTNIKFSEAKEANPLKDIRKAAAKAYVEIASSAVDDVINSKNWVRAPGGDVRRLNKDGLWVKTAGTKELQGFLQSRYGLSAPVAQNTANKLCYDLLPEVSCVQIVAHKKPGLIKINNVSILNTRLPMPKREPVTSQLDPILSWLQSVFGEGYGYFVSVCHRLVHQYDDNAPILPSQAVVILGKHGAGKTVLVTRLLPGLAGKASLMDEHALASRFTASLFECPLIVAHDALRGTTIPPATIAAKLKELTGMCEQRIEPKGKDSYVAPWSGPLIITANPGETKALPDYRETGDDVKVLYFWLSSVSGGVETVAPNNENIGDYLERLSPQFAQFCYDWVVPENIKHPRYITKAFMAPEVSAEFDERPDPLRKIEKELTNGVLMNFKDLSAGDIYDLLKTRDIANRDKVSILGKYLSEDGLGRLLVKLASRNKLLRREIPGHASKYSSIDQPEQKTTPF